MKKFSVLALTFIFMLSLTLPAFAQENGDVASYAEKAGITPDSILYPIDVALDELKIFFTLGAENKAITIINVAEERLGESEVMLDKGDVETALELVDEYNRKVEQAYEILEKAAQEDIAEQDKSADNTIFNEIEQSSQQNEQIIDLEQSGEPVGEQTTIEDGTENAEIDQTRADQNDTNTEIVNNDTPGDDKLGEQNTIEVKLRLRQENSIKVLMAVKDKLPEQARERIEKVIEMQTAKKEAVAKMVEARHRYNDSKKELKEAERQLKKAVKSGDQEKIAEAQRLIEDKQAIELQAKEQLNVAITQKKAIIKNRALNQSSQQNEDKDNETEETEQEQPIEENSNLNEETNSNEAEEIGDKNRGTNAKIKENIGNVNENGKTIQKADINQHVPKGNSPQNSSNASNGKALGRKKQ